MTKLVASSLFLFLLCGPALADPAPSTFDIGFSLTSGRELRHYAIKLVDHDCGGIEAKSPSTTDDIKVCAHVDGAQIRLQIDWLTREGERELRNKSAVLATRKSSFELDGGGAKLTVSVQ